MRITVGLVGCGRWGSNHLRTLKALKSSGRITRVVVCDIDPETLSAVDADATYASLSRMLEVENIDALAIVTPPDTHLALAREGLQHGLPLFVEKPLALHHDDAVDFLTSLPQNSVLIVGYILRHHHGVNRLFSSPVQEAVGELVSVHYQRQTVRDRPHDAEPISTLGVHGLDLIAWLLNQPLMFGKTVSKTVSADTASLEMVFPTGQRGAFEVAWSAPEERRLLHIEGDLGRASLDFGTGTIELTSKTGTAATVHSTGNDALLEEWNHFLDHLDVEGQHALPSVERLLDQSEWIHTYGGPDSV